MNKLLKMLVILSLITSYQNLSAADINYYVSVYGNNSNSGTEASPWRTIQHAVDQCTNINDDYTIYVAANPIINQNGSGKEYYNENITIGGTGVNFKSLTITGPAMEHPPSDFWYDDNEDNVVILEKARIHGSITIQKSNVRIENLRIFNTQATSATNLISISSGVSNVFVETCYIGPLCSTSLTYGFMKKKYNNQWVWAWVPNGGLNQYYEPWEYENDFQAAGKHGIFIEGDGATTSDITIQNSMIYYISGEGEGIYMRSPKPTSNSTSTIKNVLLYNNYIMLNRRSGIVAAGEIYRLSLEGNTVSLNGWYNDYFGIQDDENKVSSEYGNGLVLFDGGNNDVSKRSIINVSSSFYLNRSSGIYVFGGAEGVTINNYSDFWGNKDGIFINYTTNEPGHPLNITNDYENNNFTDIKINNNVIHSNRRFGIFYNAKQSDIKCIDAEKNYYEEPPSSFGWKGYSLSFGPTFAWGDFNHESDNFYGQSGVNFDGGRNYSNSNSDFYPEDPNLTRPSVVYGPVDINPYMSNLSTGATSNLKVDNSNTSNYFDNITNALRTLTSCSKDVIEVQGTSTNYSENITIPSAVKLLGTGSTKPKIAPSSGTIITSRSITDSEIDGFDFIIPTGTNDLLGFISTSNTNPYYTGDVTLSNNRYYRNSKRLYCYNEINPYISDAYDLSSNPNNIGEFILTGICLGDMVLWMDAANINETSGSRIANWDDRSDFDFDATAASGREPQYFSTGGIANSPYVTSTDCNNGSSADFMTFSSNAQIVLNRNTSKMVFAGFRTTTQDQRYQVLFETGNSDNGYNIVMQGGSIYFGFWRKSGSTITTSFLSDTVSANIDYLVAMYYDASKSSNNIGFYKNGRTGTGTFAGWINSELNQDPNNSNYYYFSGIAGILGSDGGSTSTRLNNTTPNNNAHWPMCGLLTELLVYDSYSSGKINEIIEYFNEKYGTSLSSTSSSSGGKKKKEQNDANDDFVTINFAGQLSYPYPNPFTNSTNFSVMLNRSQNVTIDLYDALGNKVQSFYKGALEANQIYNYTIDGSNLPPGLYIYRLSGEDFTESGKVVLVK